MNKKALITGISGQDGSYLAEFLLDKGYEVHGVIRRSSSINTSRLDLIYDNKDLHLYYGDLTDSLSVDDIVHKVMPDELYHLAAQSQVRVSFDVPKYTGEVDALGTLYVMEAVKKHCPGARVYNAATSELFGDVKESPQSEKTPFNPRSPYACAKLYSYWIVKNYREAYNIYACNGILFNHESPRRGETFITKKVITKLVQIAKSEGSFTPLYIGNLEATRDWGYAPEYVEGMWRMLQQDTPEDFVLATNESHSVRELIEEVCDHLEFELEWTGEGLNEIGYSWKFKNPIIKIDHRYFRPLEVNALKGDFSKAKEKMGWEPKIKFKKLIKIMINALQI